MQDAMRIGSPTSAGRDEDMSTREAVERYLTRRLRQLGKLLVIGLVATPAAVAAVVIGRNLMRGRMPPASSLVPAIAVWSAVTVAIIGLVVVLLGIKRVKLARRVRPILRQGVQRQGRIDNVEHSSRKGAGGVTFNAVTITVGLDDARLRATIEESEGTELPSVDVGALATAWTLEGRSVVGTCGSLFETSLQPR